MIPIQDLINKIKWDKRENPKDYTIVYFDRLKGNKEIPYTAIKGMEGNFMLLLNERGEETEIPLHRIRKVIKKGKVVWERKKEEEKT